MNRRFGRIGHTLEHDDAAWLVEVHGERHALATHTCDPVLLTADSPKKLQFKFRRAPWLVEAYQEISYPLAFDRQASWRGMRWRPVHRLQDAQ